MGGIFSHHLRDITTHLMVGKVGSQKYNVRLINNTFSLLKFKWHDCF